ncbi:MAG TPA: hypothetical protein VN026_02860 [Bacteroidia bacterium]|jgi:hypothetical protein|nr:hypothetical protein [Bacteroidia bacterium]
MITTADLNKIKDTLLENMKENFKNDGEIYPVVIVITPNGDMHLIATPYSNQQEKNEMMNEVMTMCKNLDAIALFLINEAWIKKIKVEDYNKFTKEMDDKNKRISDYDDKEEVAMMMFETKLHCETIMFELDKVNRQLINRKGGMTKGGNFANILSPIINNN